MRLRCGGLLLKYEVEPKPEFFFITELCLVGHTLTHLTLLSQMHVGVFARQRKLFC